MNFLFSFDNCAGIECHTILMRGTSFAGACLEKSLSYASRIFFWMVLTLLGSLPVAKDNTAEGIPPTKKYCRNRSSNLFLNIVIICQSFDCKRFTILFSPMASRNSKNVRGYKCMKSTFPTGKDSFLCIAMPSKEPAAITWY